jgi:hypothetical protein
MAPKLPFLRSIAVIALVLHLTDAKINLDFLSKRYRVPYLFCSHPISTERMPQPSPEELSEARQAMILMCQRNYGESVNVDPNDMISQICSGLLASGQEYK